MKKRLFQPVDISSLVFFRIVFGILGFADVLGTWIYYHLMKGAYDPDKFQFKYYGFEWVQPFPEPFMSIFFLILCCLAVFIILGKWYRFVTPIFALGFTYTYFLEKAHYLNHGYLFCWICFVMIFLPANRQFSADVLRRPELKRQFMPYWPLFVLQFFMGIVYFFGGIAKINPDWLAAIPLHQWISYRSDMPILGPLLELKETAYFMAYGGLLLDLTAAFFLMFRRTRPWIFIAIIFFHFINSLIFAIGIFPSLSLALSALYFSPSFPRKWVSWLSERVKIVARIDNWWVRRTTVEYETAMWQEQKSWQPAIAYVLAGTIVLHLLLPLRHHLYPGDVAWTEEGHRYSWRMMLRAKQGYGTFLVKDKENGEIEKINPRDYLRDKQRRKLYTHPDMILQFAHFLRDEYEKKGQQVEIYADIKVKLNYRKYGVYIDPEVDLASVEWQFFKSADWIVPEKR